MRERKNILIAVLIVLVLLSVGYIIYNVYAQVQSQKQISIYQQGAQLGYEQAVSQLFQQAITCQQVPVTINNQTINIIWVECLQGLGTG